MSDTPTAPGDPFDTLADLSGSRYAFGFFAKFLIRERGSPRWLHATAAYTPTIWAQGIIRVTVEGHGALAMTSRAIRGQSVDCKFEGLRFVATVGLDSPKPRVLWLFATDLLDAVFGTPLLTP